MVPSEQVIASQVRAIEFHQKPDLHAQDVTVAVPVELMTVEQSRHRLEAGNSR
jgi:hypothetical protein